MQTSTLALNPWVRAFQMVALLQKQQYQRNGSTMFQKRWCHSVTHPLRRCMLTMLAGPPSRGLCSTCWTGIRKECAPGAMGGALGWAHSACANRHSTAAVSASCCTLASGAAPAQERKGFSCCMTTWFFLLSRKGHRLGDFCLSINQRVTRRPTNRTAIEHSTAPQPLPSPNFPQLPGEGGG